jgi:hypothetical protein
MYLMYVDESGDPGMTNSPSSVFILSGLVLHELRWRQCLDQMLAFRRRMKALYGLKVREEIHARDFISSPGGLVRIPLQDRVSILRALTSELTGMTDMVSLVNVVITKTGKQADFDCFDWAWRLLLQRFENGISNRNFNGPINSDERGMVFPDNTDSAKVTRLIRRIRRYNPIPNKGNSPVQFVIEDPSFRESEASYLVQAADLVTYALCQKLLPNRRAKRHGVHNLFDRLDPVLYKPASAKDPQGVVYM